jgi:hypothetical protein
MARPIQPTKLKEAIDKLGMDVVADLAKQLLSADKKATGELINSLKYEVLEVVDAVMLRIKALDYFKYVDKGRRPGAKPPPVAAIIPWVETKGIIIGKNTTKQTAFIIARSIGIKGIQPLNMKQNVIDNIIKTRTQILQQAYKEDIKNHYDEIIKEVQEIINK